MITRLLDKEEKVLVFVTSLNMHVADNGNASSRDHRVYTWFSKLALDEV